MIYSNQLGFMKKVVLFLLMSLGQIISLHSQEIQIIDSLAIDSVVSEKVAKDSVFFTPKDSLYLNYISDVAEFIVKNIESVKPRYKMYKTDNLYNLIELDTATGRLWQVQFGMNRSSSRMKVAIDDSSLLYDWEDIIPGRFELYPTSNMYTFILLDTHRGWTYQVQWNTEPSKRFRISIY